MGECSSGGEFSHSGVLRHRTTLAQGRPMLRAIIFNHALGGISQLVVSTVLFGSEEFLRSDLPSVVERDLLSLAGQVVR